MDQSTYCYLLKMSNSTSAEHFATASASFSIGLVLLGILNTLSGSPQEIDSPCEHMCSLIEKSEVKKMDIDIDFVNISHTR